MKVLLLLMLLLSIVADDAADSYLCFGQPQLALNSILDDDDDDDSRHHHRLHCECQHEGNAQTTHAGKHLQKPHQKHCICQIHHELYWVPSSAHNPFPRNFELLRFFPEDDRFVPEDIMYLPLRPPMIAA